MTSPPRTPGLVPGASWAAARWVLPALVVLVGLSTFLATRDERRAAYPVWVAISAQWHEALWTTGPIVAAASAALAAAAPGPWRPAVLAWRGLAVAAWCSLGHGLGLLPLLVSGWRGATSGGLDVQDVVVGLSGLGVLAVGGCCVGAVIRHWTVVPVVAVVTFVLLALPQAPLLRPLGLVLPVRHFVASARFEPNLATTLFAVIAGTVLCLFATHLAAVAIAGAPAGNPDRSARDGALSWGAAAVVLVAVAFAWRPELYVVDRPVPQQCEQTRVRVCLHPANRSATDEIQAVLSALDAAGATTGLQQVTDLAVADRDAPLAGEVLLRLDPGPVPPGTVGTLADQVAYQVTGTLLLGSCAAGSRQSAAFATAVQRRVLQVAGFSRLADAVGPADDEPAARALAALDASGLTRFLRTHHAAVASCTLSPAALPV